MIKIATKILLILSFTMTLLGCEQNEKIKLTQSIPQCIPSQSSCIIHSSTGDFSILFSSQPIVTETPFNIILITPEKHSISSISAHMEGKNMFMGKIPLFFQDQTQQYQAKGLNISIEDSTKNNSSLFYVADTLLGSCNEENMRWIVYFNITLNTQTGPVTEQFTIEFDSQRVN